MTAVRLQSLLNSLPEGWGRVLQPAGDPAALAITGVAEDSRRVQPGTLFLARRGRGTDGHRYIPAAIAAGAGAVAGELRPDELPAPFPAGLPYLQVADGRTAFALLSAAFFDFPSRQMAIVGVTGTDGKTTTSTFVHSILAAAGMRTGLITTISALIGDAALDTGFHVTTPEAFDLQGYLAQMRAAGCTAAVVETTSHGLDQARVAYVDYDVAVVTNVTHEHLDWHGSWENYMAAKARLFDALSTSVPKPGVPKTAVLNRTDRSYAWLKDKPADQVMTYAIDGQAATCTASAIVVDRHGTRFLLHAPDGTVAVQLHLLGRYNVQNALAAACAGRALGARLPAIAAGLGAVERVKGRMEWVYAGEFDLVVDFAHTPNALKETLELGHELVPPGGRVIPVFGSAGLRDVAKRRLMGEIAGQLADFSVVTAEDPRTEDVAAIMGAIAEGLEAHGRQAGRDFICVADRATAIARAVALARPGDLVVTCGKAHEQSMCYGSTETPWDEFAAAQAALAARGLAAAEPARA
ncbi:MAG TPA: UDP-N-acetylmuramoyl-L-alanyl-D-glutamate--2,6-diaminopimelate ligase [Chloroflexia bacterium]|nr:UDP-N-acetylmuramoyl-L-alanyl-D-glutamate--2,6-diaminopimelate ligase [Chloroflexia bacterium]